MGSKESILNYGLIVMTLTHTLTHVFVGIHPSIFSILRDEFSLSLQQLGYIAAIPPLCQALLAIPTGLLSDRYGSKKMLLASLLVAELGALLASQTRNPLMFIVAISLVYVNTTIYHPASYGFTTRMFKASDMPKALGLHGAGGTLGYALGPLSVSILIGLFSFGWRQVYLLLAAPLFLGIIMVLRIKDEPVDEREIPPTRSKPVDQPFLTASLVMFLVYSAFIHMGGSMISNFIVLYLQDVKGLTIALASFISSATTLTGLLAAPIGGYIASSFGEKKWLLTSLTLSHSFLGFSIILPNVTWFSTNYIAYGFCNTLGMAARNAVLAKLSPSRQRSLGYALFFLPGSMMGAVAPMVAAFVAEAFGFTTIFYISLGISIIAISILKFSVKVKA
jgi:MFS family permease